MLKSNPRSSGFSLFEILVTMTLVGIIGVMFIWVLVPTMHMTASGTARVDVQQAALFCANRIDRELQEHSARGAITILSKAEALPGEPVVIAAIPFSDVGDDGKRIWEQKVSCFYWDPNLKTVFQKHWPPGPPAAFSVDPLPTNHPIEFEKDELLALASGGQPTAHRVVAFDARWSDPDKKEVVIMDVSVEQETAGKQAPERFDYTRVLSLRN